MDINSTYQCDTIGGIIRLYRTWNMSSRDVKRKKQKQGEKYSVVQRALHGYYRSKTPKIWGCLYGEITKERVGEFIWKVKKGGIEASHRQRRVQKGHMKEGESQGLAMLQSSGLWFDSHFYGVLQIY